jgi:hypothetical protein
LKSNRNLGQRGQPAIYFRRIVISASKDVGLPDPEALPLAIATQQAVTVCFSRGMRCSYGALSPSAFMLPLSGGPPGRGYMDL